MSRDLYELAGDKYHTGEIREQWAIGIWGIVAINEDPEHQDRIKVIIPVIEENQICDKWVRPLVRWSGPKGFGDSHRPAQGSEVIIFGEQGEDHNLYYVSTYNEDYLVPEELRSKDVRGFKSDKDYKQLVGRDYEIQVGGKLKITAGSIRIDVDGPVEINASRIDPECRRRCLCQRQEIGYLMTIQGSAIDFPFRSDVRGSLATTADKSKIIAQSIASILETRQGERVMLPDYGIPDFVFEVVDAGFTARLAYFVELQLNRYEPLVEEARAVIGTVVDEDGFALGFTEDQQRAAVSITYRERGQSTPRNLVFPTWQLREVDSE